MPIRSACFLKKDDLAGSAVLNKCIITPRKMSIVADVIRNKPVPIAFSLLENINKNCTSLFIKLLKSAVSNFELRCDRLKENFCNIDNLYISMVCVGSAGMLKRVLPAPHGRALTVRKRLSNIIIIVRPLPSSSSNGKNNASADTNKKKKTSKRSIKVRKSSTKNSSAKDVKKNVKKKEVADNGEGDVIKNEIES